MKIHFAILISADGKAECIHRLSEERRLALRSGFQVTLYINNVGFRNCRGLANSLLVRRPLTTPCFRRSREERIGAFLAPDGTVVIHPEPAQFFEVPISSSLPEDPNFIR